MKMGTPTMVWHSPAHFRASYAPIAARIFLADTPGPTCLKNRRSVPGGMRRGDAQVIGQASVVGVAPNGLGFPVQMVRGGCFFTVASFPGSHERTPSVGARLAPRAIRNLPAPRVLAVALAPDFAAAQAKEGT